MTLNVKLGDRSCMFLRFEAMYGLALLGINNKLKQFFGCKWEEQVLKNAEFLYWFQKESILQKSCFEVNSSTYC